MSKFCEKNVFWGEFWLTVSDRDTETTQILYHSQTNTFAVISRIFLGIMDSSLFLEWCTNQSGFPKKSQFRNYGTQARYLWRGIINEITEGNHIDDLRSSEPILGSSLFLYGQKKSPNPRFSIITIRS